MSIRTAASRGHREVNETLKQLDTGVVVLTDRHIYFQGQDKERFRVRLDRLVSTEILYDGMRFQRDGVRARPEAFLSYDARMLAVLIEWLDAPPDPGPYLQVEQAHDDDLYGMVAAAEADVAVSD